MRHGLSTLMLALGLLASSVPPVWAQPANPAQPAQPASPPEAEVEERDGEQRDLPLKADLQVPTAQELLQGPAFDRIVLRADRVIISEPVSPRPGTLEQMNAKIKASLKNKLFNESPEQIAERQKLYQLRLTLLNEKEGVEYSLNIELVKEIIHFEDLYLQRIDILLGVGDAAGAQQLLIALDARHKGWPGWTERQRRLIWVEADQKLKQGLPEHALTLLEELHAVEPKYPELFNRLGVVTDDLIATALQWEDFRCARHFISRLQTREPSHGVAQRRSDELLAMTREAMKLSASLESKGEFSAAVQAMERAAVIWPATPELKSAHSRLCNRWQRLHVGVVALETPLTPAKGTADPSAGEAGDAAAVSVTLPLSRSEFDEPEAVRRVRWLTERRLFRPDRTGVKTIRYQSPFLEEWEPTQLGHSVRLTMQLQRKTWESRPMLTSGEVAAALRSRLDPRHADFDERLAAIVESIGVRTPGEFEVRFRTVPLRPEALFSFPVGGQAGTASPFHRVQSDEQKAVYQRTFAEPPAPADWHLAEVVEVKYQNHDKAIQGLLRGEVSLLAQVPAWNVPALQKHADLLVDRYALPRTHFLQFHPDSKAATSRTLRRALVYALDRSRMLNELFLHDPASRYGRLTSAPMPTQSYAYSPAVVPHKYDPVLAVSLMVAANKEFGKALPGLVLMVPEEPALQEAAAQIADSWKRLGLKVTVVPPTTSNWDVAYRTCSLAEPLVELWPCLTQPAGTKVEALRNVPPWLREQLLQLDAASDWPTAEGLLYRIHRQLWADVQNIPLWELDQVYAARKTIKGMPSRPLETYADCERWKIDPWYPKDQ